MFHEGKGTRRNACCFLLCNLIFKILGNYTMPCPKYESFPSLQYQTNPLPCQKFIVLTSSCLEQTAFNVFSQFQAEIVVFQRP